MCDRHNFFFEFDKAFTAQLIEKFEASPEHRLSEDVAPPQKGVYAVYWKGGLVYAGKALQTTLRRRFAEHTRKIAGRKNIRLAEVTCRFLIIGSDWFVRAGEHALIESYDPNGTRLALAAMFPAEADLGYGPLGGIRNFLPDDNFMP